jgi:hypothetical protein
VALLEKALTYPHNLGEGKLIGNLDNDIYYKMGCISEERREELFALAARGDFELSSAKYYNDQPPEMMYYSVMALKRLGCEEKAKKLFEAFIEYGDSHMDDEVRIDYFAVSLPDFLIFDTDLNKKNRVHCLYMKALGYLGCGETERAKECAEAGLEIEHCHRGFIDILNDNMEVI